MKVVKAFGPGDLRIVDAPIPEPLQGEVLIKVMASGICGSDKWYWSVPGPTESIAGHEVAGEVAALGLGVTHLKVGDRVAVNNVVGCGTCPDCAVGAFVRCPNWNGSHDVNNGLSEFIKAPEVNCMKLADSIGYETGCLLFDNWGTPYGGIERANVRGDDCVLITGCGPIGLCAVALAKSRGAYVMAMDPLPYRLDAAQRMGADAILTPGPNAIGQVKEYTNQVGSSVHIDCSGNGAAYDFGLNALRVGGTFVCIGEHAKVDFHPSDFVIRKHLTLMGTWYTTMKQGLAVQDLIHQGLIKNPTAFVTHRVTLDDVPNIFGKVCACTDDILKAVILF